MALILDKENPLATKIKTRDGREARLICVDKWGSDPIVALIKEQGGEVIYQLSPNGRYLSNSESEIDLFNVDEKSDRIISSLDTLIKLATQLKEDLT